MIKKLKPYLITYILIQLFAGSVLPIITFSATESPTVTLDSPLVQGKSVTLYGTAQRAGLDNPDGVNLELVETSGSSINIGSPVDGTWTYSLFKSEGQYSYTIKGTDVDDTAGLYSTSIPFTLTVDGTGPTIVVTSPMNQGKNITISGTVEDNYTLGNEISMELLDLDNNPIPNVNYSPPSESSKDWSFALSGDFTEDTYQYKIKATDRYNNTTVLPVTVTVGFKPKVKSIKLNLSDKVAEAGQSEIDLISNEKMSYIKKDSSITITITDDKLLSLDKINNPIMVYSSAGENVTGSTTKEMISDTEYKIVFIPSELKASTTYYIYINPAYIDLSPGSPATTDAAGNPLYPLIRKFTTESPVDSSTFTEAQQAYHGLNDPHGNLSNNTNTCINCHSTHESSESKLGQASFDYSTYNYCMACHDGTVAALPENMSQNGHFPAYNDTAVKKMATDCSTCHNPHLTWRAENPSLLDDHYIVENHPAVEGMTADMFDSDKVLCESCHEDNSGIVKEYVPKSPEDPIKVTYKVLHYRKETATGVSDDYALCFRCHDGSRENIANIKMYYENSNSKHRLTAQDGGKLVSSPGGNDGHIPCAECHGSHGSDNIKILNNKIGHEDRRGYSAPSDVPGEWDAGKERAFCIKCHNGSTSIYGVTSAKLEPLPNNATGHGSTDTEACSMCHGVDETNKTTATAKEKSLRATHAPSPGVMP